MQFARGLLPLMDTKGRQDIEKVVEAYGSVLKGMPSRTLRDTYVPYMMVTHSQTYGCGYGLCTFHKQPSPCQPH